MEVKDNMGNTELASEGIESSRVPDVLGEIVPDVNIHKHAYIKAHDQKNAQSWQCLYISWKDNYLLLWNEIML